ncbi:UbiA prenyltransferase family-domain-containing protein [Mycena vulgaris]|nr:UbiA prenyltransferase family-domain-containing protein [Mycena vulgaris]
MPRLLRAISRISVELDIFFAFSWWDWSTTIIPGCIWGIGAALAGQVSPTSILYRFPRLIVWLTLFIYLFNLSNQIVGISEDCVNKPNRPIPSGKVTLAGAKRRAVVVLVAFLAIGTISPCLLPESICWALATGFLSWTSAGHHWFGKNTVALIPGTWALLSGSWRSVSALTPAAKGYIYGMALWSALLTNIQDLRDVIGDRATGRRTLAVVFGPVRARRIITGGTIPAAIWVLWAWNILAVAPVSITVAHVFLGYRVISAEAGPRYDHKTYMMYTYLFCLTLALLAVQDVIPVWLRV